MDAAGIWERLRRGAEYLSALDASASWDWLGQYGRLLRGQLSIVESLVLAHPRHYSDLDAQALIRGPRRFSPEAAIGGISCQAELVWGYRCSRPLGETVVADHLFPYSLGGPTLGANKLYLCEAHNQMKANDIHLFPWERGLPAWLPGCLAGIEKLKRVRGS